MYVIQNLVDKHKFLLETDTKPKWVDRLDASQYKRTVDAQRVVDKQALSRFARVVQI